jgi:hypothetical protein
MKQVVQCAHLTMTVNKCIVLWLNGLHLDRYVGRQ